MKSSGLTEVSSDTEAEASRQTTETTSWALLDLETECLKVDAIRNLAGVPQHGEEEYTQGQGPQSQAKSLELVHLHNGR
jgi:hypothetical protein